MNISLLLSPLNFPPLQSAVTRTNSLIPPSSRHYAQQTFCVLCMSDLSRQICSDIISTALLSIYFHVSAGLHCSNKLGIYEWMCLTIFVAAIIWWTVYPSHPHRWEGLARYLGRMLSSTRRGRVDGGREHFGSLTMKQQPRLSRSLTQPRLESLNKNVFFYFR